MRLVDHLLSLADIWARASDRSTARLATVVAKDGGLFPRIADGGSITLATFEKFLTYFRDAANWPDHVIPPDAAALLAALPNGAAEAISAVHAEDVSPLSSPLSTGKAREVSRAADRGAAA